MRHPADSPEAELAGDFLAMAAERRQERDAALAEVTALRAIIEGRTAPPTLAEARAHDKHWLVMLDDGKGNPLPWTTLSPLRAPTSTTRFLRFIPLDADGKPCAWPVVSR